MRASEVCSVLWDLPLVERWPVACSRSSDCGAKKWRQTLIVYDDNDNNNNNNNNNKFIFCNYQCKNFQLSRYNHKEQKVKKK